MRIRNSAVVALAACFLLLIPATAFGGKGGGGGGGSAGCNLPDSNAESFDILSNYYPGYWWDHTDLTIAVEAHPAATDEQLDAIDSAIDTWSLTLADCFDGLITLTNVTGSKRPAADIVVHYVPTAGGAALEQMVRSRRSVGRRGAGLPVQLGAASGRQRFVETIAE